MVVKAPLECRVLTQSTSVLDTSHLPHCAWSHSPFDSAACLVVHASSRVSMQLINHAIILSLERVESGFFVSCSRSRSLWGVASGEVGTWYGRKGR